MCRAAGCTRATYRPGNADPFGLCPTCTDRILAGHVVMSTPAREGYIPPALARSGGPVPAGSRSA